MAAPITPPAKKEIFHSKKLNLMPEHMPELERRTIAHKVEIRANEDGTQSRTVVGYAAKFNTESELLGFGFVEVIEPGAFDDVMNDDVRALFNHDPNLILARSSAGTLSLSLDEVGLRYEFEAPESTRGNDLLCDLQLGNIRESSFGFQVAESEWEEIVNPDNSIKEIRRIKKVKALFDVSPVTFPAYHATEVTVRSLQQFRENKKPKQIDFDFETRIRLNENTLLLTK